MTDSDSTPQGTRTAEQTEPTTLAVASWPGTAQSGTQPQAGSPAAAVRLGRNPATLLVIAAACLLSVAAYLHFYPHGQTIAYGDAKSHLLIARRVIFADTPGAGQLGGVWLPLPHILMLPFIWNNWAYYSGFAGSVVMMICYVVCTMFVYKITWRLTGRHSA